jgi:predicted acetyltransferase
MESQLVKALYQHKNVIKNLMQFYMYDFSEFIDMDVEEDGLFQNYKNLDDYWNDESRSPYVIQQDGKYIGFVLVRLIETATRKYFSIAEFFVMKKYRLAGVGKIIAYQIFDLYKGNWEVFQKETNKPAQLFWKKIIDGYTKGDFTEKFEDGKLVQLFKN